MKIKNFSKRHFIVPSGEKGLNRQFLLPKEQASVCLCWHVLSNNRVMAIEISSQTSLVIQTSHPASSLKYRIIIYALTLKVTI